MSTIASLEETSIIPERELPSVVLKAEKINPYDVDEDGWIASERGPIDEPNQDISAVIVHGETNNMVAAE